MALRTTHNNNHHHNINNSNNHHHKSNVPQLSMLAIQGGPSSNNSNYNSMMIQQQQNHSFQQASPSSAILSNHSSSFSFISNPNSPSHHYHHSFFQSPPQQSQQQQQNQSYYDSSFQQNSSSPVVISGLKVNVSSQKLHHGNSSSSNASSTAAIMSAQNGAVGGGGPHMVSIATNTTPTPVTGASTANFFLTEVNIHEQQQQQLQANAAFTEKAKQEFTQAYNQVNTGASVRVMDMSSMVMDHSSDPNVSVPRYMNTTKRASSTFHKVSKRDLPPVQSLNLVASQQSMNHGVVNHNPIISKTLLNELRRGGIEVANHHSRDDHYSSSQMRNNVGTIPQQMRSKQRFPIRQNLNPNVHKLALNLFKDTSNFDPALFTGFREETSTVVASKESAPEKSEESNDSVSVYSSTSRSSRHSSVSNKSTSRSLPPIAAKSETQSVSSIAGKRVQEEGQKDSCSSTRPPSPSKSVVSNRVSEVSSKQVTSSRTNPPSTTSRMSKANNTNRPRENMDSTRPSHDAVSTRSIRSQKSRASAPSYFSIGSDADSDRIVQLEENLRNEQEATRDVQKALNDVRRRQEELMARLDPSEREKFLGEMTPVHKETIKDRGLTDRRLNLLRELSSDNSMRSKNASIVSGHSNRSNHSDRSVTSAKLKSTEQEVKQLKKLITKMASTVLNKDHQPEGDVKQLVVKFLQNKPELFNDPEIRNALQHSSGSSDLDYKQGLSFRSQFYKDHNGKVILNY